MDDNKLKISSNFKDQLFISLVWMLFVLVFGSNFMTFMIARELGRNQEAIVNLNQKVFIDKEVISNGR